MENLIKNIATGAHRQTGGPSGFNLARQIADENEAATGNRCIVRRVLDFADNYEGHRREHYSFDIVEIIKEG